MLHYIGTYYAYDMISGGTGTGATVRGIMPQTAGGIGSFPTYTGATPFSPAVITWSVAWGTIKPMGGFLSKNRDYFYVVNMHPISTSDQGPNVLLGVNVENLSGSSTPSGICENSEL